MSSSSREHRRRATEASSRDPVRCAVLTISDTRTAPTDLSGPLIERLLAEHGHRVVDRAIVRDDAAAIAAQLGNWIADDRTQVVLTTGGTGLARRDTSIEVVRGLITVEIEGFGELFRMLSHRRIGAAASPSPASTGRRASSVRHGLVAAPSGVPSSSPGRARAPRSRGAPRTSSASRRTAHTPGSVATACVVGPKPLGSVTSCFPS